MTRGAAGLREPADIHRELWLDPQWVTSLPREEPFYLLASEPIGTRLSRVYVFDGDDTLWKDEYLYTAARARIVHALRTTFSPVMSDEMLATELATTCMMAVKEGGYGYRAFLAAAKHFWTWVSEQCRSREEMPSALETWIVCHFTDSVPAVADDVRATLSLLAARGDNTVLYTLGAVDEQLRKVAMTGLAELFRTICVVRFKTDATLNRLVKELRLRGYPNDILIVSDSYGRDIAPAIALGLEARLLSRPDWQGMPDDADDAKFVAPTIRSLWEIV